MITADSSLIKQVAPNSVSTSTVSRTVYFSSDIESNEMSQLMMQVFFGSETRQQCNASAIRWHKLHERVIYSRVERSLG